MDERERPCLRKFNVRNRLSAALKPTFQAPVARFRSVEDGATPDNVSPQHLRGTHDMILPTRSWFELGTMAAVRVNAQLSRYTVVTAEGVRLATRIQGDCQLLGTLGLDTQCWALAPP